MRRDQCLPLYSLGDRAQRRAERSIWIEAIVIEQQGPEKASQSFAGTQIPSRARVGILTDFRSTAPSASLFMYAAPEEHFCRCGPFAQARRAQEEWTCCSAAVITWIASSQVLDMSGSRGRLLSVWNMVCPADAFRRAAD